MTTWRELYKFNGSYESMPHDISSAYDLYVVNFYPVYNENDGNIDVEISLSEDGGETWGDWISIKDNYQSLFNRLESLSNIKFKYRINFEVYDFTENPPVFNSFKTGFTGGMKIYNLGDNICKPELWITKLNTDGEVQLKNETNGQIMIIDQMVANETIYVDCENEDLITDLPLTYRFDNFNNTYLQFEIGENIITGLGDFKIDFRYEFITSQG